MATTTTESTEATLETLGGSLRGKIAEEIRSQVEQELVQNRADVTAGYDRSPGVHDRYQSA